MGDSGGISAVDRSFNLLLLTVRKITTELAPFEPRVSTERNEALGIPGDVSDSSMYRRLDYVATKQQFRPGMNGARRAGGS